MFEEIIKGVLITGALITVIYGQYLLLRDRDEYRKQHKYDPWRHGWEDKQD